MRYWIFQGKSSSIQNNGMRWINEIRQDDYFNWSITRYKNEIKTDDIVLLWLSGKNAGIVAEFVITGFFEEDGVLYSDLLKTQIFEPLIEREKIKQVIPNHAIIKAGVGTNFAITDDEYFKIMALADIKPMTLDLLNELFPVKDQTTDVINNSIPDTEESDKINVEGEMTEKTILSRKRYQSVVKHLKQLKNYTCEVCGYRKLIGENYIIDVHHIDGLALKGESEVTQNDLLCLCPNCHRIAHINGYKEKPLTLNELLCLTTDNQTFPDSAP